MPALPSNPRNAVIHDAEFTRKNYNTVALSSNPKNSFIHDAEIMKKNYYVVTLCLPTQNTGSNITISREAEKE